MLAEPCKISNIYEERQLDLHAQLQILEPSKLKSIVNNQNSLYRSISLSSVRQELIHSGLYSMARFQENSINDGGLDLGAHHHQPQLHV